MRILLVFTFIISIGLFPAGSLYAQDDEVCPAIVDEALTATNNICDGTGRNQACYGNLFLDAVLQPDATITTFDQPGNIVDVTEIQTLRLAPLDATANIWGVALMRVQTNLPDTLPGQNVTFLLFGDVEITNAAPLMTDAAAPDETPFGPFQAFFFRSGIGDAPCAAAPNSGILIQTPEGAGEINLQVNGVDVNLGSTAFFQAEAEEEMEMVAAVLEGEMTVTAFDTTQTVPAGALVRVPIDENLEASGPPEEPEPIDETRISALPLDNLEREVPPPPPFSPGVAIGVEPVAGDWVYATGEVSLGGECVGLNASFFPQVTQVVPFSGNLAADIESEFAQANNIGLPPGFAFTNPEPGVWTMEGSAEGGQFRWEMRVVSETRIEGQTTIAAAGCTITIPFEMTPQDG